MITSGIAADKQKQKQSLAWIREQSLDPDCIESLANHDPDIAPHIIELWLSIYKVKYLSVCVGNEDCDDGVEIFRENGEKLDPFDDEAPLYYGNFHFTVDVDTGRILDWPDAKLYAEVNMRAIDTGSYDFWDKDDNKIYEEQGYVPDFLGISSQAYGDDICFDTDVNGYILGWKEKKIKEQIIEHLRKYILDEFNY